MGLGMQTYSWYWFEGSLDSGPPKGQSVYHAANVCFESVLVCHCPRERWSDIVVSETFERELAKEVQENTSALTYL